VAATDAPLEEHIREGRFRAPLLHRLAGYEIRLPPLRERPEDIGLLFFHFARPELEALGEATRLLPEDPLAEPWLSPALVLLLLRHPWSGNVRQLRNVARQVVISSRGQPHTQMDPRVLRELGLEPPPSRPRKASGDARRKPSEVTEQELVEALRACAWDLKATAARLGITRGSLYNLIDRSSRIRTVKDVGPEEIIQCFQACEGNLDEMVQRLEVSRSALQRRVKELGLSARRR
jgi:two-component system nitrogen regulation response regulator GlnG